MHSDARILETILYVVTEAFDDWFSSIGLK